MFTYMSYVTSYICHIKEDKSALAECGSFNEWTCMPWSDKLHRVTGKMNAVLVIVKQFIVG